MRFDPLTSESCPEGSRKIAAASEKKFGFLPSPVATASRSPALLGHLIASFAAYDRCSLSALEREVVALTVAFENECHYCVAMHTATLVASGAHQDQVSALRAGTPLDDARLEALRRFARELYIERGRVTEETMRAFEGAGYDEEAALDVVLGVGTYVLSTLSNVLTGAPLDSAFEAFRWAKPVEAKPESRGVARS